MTCEEALELMSAALDGEATPEMCAALDEHLARCRGCQGMYETLRGQSRLLRELDCQVPVGLTERILSQLPQQSDAPDFPSDARAAPASGPPGKGRAARWKRWGALAACAVLVLWAGLTLPSQFSMGSSGSSSAANETAAQADGDDGGYTGPTAVQNDATGGTAHQQADPNEAAGVPDTDGQDDLGVGGAAEADGQSRTAPEGASGGTNALALTDVRYLQVTQAPETTAQLLDSADELAACLAQFPDDDLAQATEDYGDGFFERGALIAVTLTENDSAGFYRVESIRSSGNGYVIVLLGDKSAQPVSQSAWLILIETDQVIDPSDTLTVTLIDTDQ